MTKNRFRTVFFGISLIAGCAGTADGGNDDASDAEDATEESATDAHVEDSIADAHHDADAETAIDAHPDTTPDAKPDLTPPNIDSFPWETGATVGYGVAFKDAHNPMGENVFIAYGGYNVTLSDTEDWATALYKATLESKGVRYVWAVQGPADPSYSGKEIGNSKIIAAMLPKVNASTKFILAVGHSSGTFVANELLGQLDGGLDPSGITKGKVVYFDLDGGTTGLDASIVGRCRKAYFCGSWDGSTSSPNDADMQSAGATYASAGGYWRNDASSSGCNAGANWCVHMTLITTRPHDPNAAQPIDYADFAGRPVSHAYLEAKAKEAGLTP